MRAVVQDGYGEADVLRTAEVPRPVPGSGQVLVRVLATGVDRGLWHLMAGLPYPVRLAGYGLRSPRQPVRGREIAGEVVALGPDVTAHTVGDVVFGFAEAALAEYVVTGEVVAAPRGLSPAEAAALPISGTTALQAVRDHGRVTAGHEVLVIGASGGVGSLAAQLAVAEGARVTGVCSAAKADAVRALGVHEVVPRAPRGLPPLSRRFDVVIDTGGDAPLRELRRVLTPSGTLVLVGGEGAGGRSGRWFGGLDRQLRMLLVGPFTRQRLRAFVARENTADLDVLRERVESGRLAPVVARTFPLDEAAEAVRHLVAGRATGKVVVAVAAGHNKITSDSVITQRG